MSFASKLRRDAASKNMHSKMCSGLYNLAFDVRTNCKGAARAGHLNYRNLNKYFDLCPPEEDFWAFLDLLKTLLDGCSVRVVVSPADPPKWKVGGEVLVEVIVDWCEGSEHECCSLSMPVAPVLTPSEQYEAGTPKELPQRTVAQTLAGARKR